MSAGNDYIEALLEGYKNNQENSVKDKNEMLLELDGQVFIVDKKNGKVVSREPLDGKLVLQCVIQCLKDGIKLMEDKK